MKKISMIFLTSALLFMTFVGSISASELLEKDKAPFYTNDLGVEMTEQEYNNLLKGFPEETIASMPEGMVNLYKNDENLTKFEKVQYVKSDIEYDLLGNVISQKETIISEEEYNRPVMQRVNGSTGTPTHETSHKKITMTYTKGGVSSGQAAVTLTNEWKQEPSVKSVDVIGMRFQDERALLKTNDTFFGYQRYKDENGNEQSIFYGTGNTTNWKFQGYCIATACRVTGLGLSQNLKNTGSNFRNSLTVNLGGLSANYTVWGAYEHATTNVTLEESQKYSINSSGKGAVFDFQSSVINKYDDTKGVQVTIP